MIRQTNPLSMAGGHCFRGRGLVGGKASGKSGPYHGGPATLMEPSTLGRWDGLVVAQSDQTWVFEKIGVAGTSNSPSQIWRILPVSPSCSRPSLGSRSRVPFERRTFRLREAGKPWSSGTPHGPCNGSKAIRWVCFCRWAKKPPAGQKVYVRINEEENLWVVDAFMVGSAQP